MKVLDTIEKRYVEVDEQTIKKRIEIGILYRYLDKSKELKNLIEYTLKDTHYQLRKFKYIKETYEKTDRKYLISKTKINIKKEIDILNDIINNINKIYNINVNFNTIDSKIKELIYKVKNNTVLLNTINFKWYCGSGNIVYNNGFFYFIPKFIQIEEPEIVRSIEKKKQIESPVVITYRKKRTVININDIINKEDDVFAGVNVFPVEAFRNLRKLLTF